MRGKGIMRSNFVSAKYRGQADFGVQIKYGKNKDDYWKGANVLDQLKNVVIPLLWERFSNSDHCFIFDYSSNHKWQQPDALNMRHMGLNDGNAHLLCDNMFERDSQLFLQSLCIKMVKKGVRGMYGKGI